MHDSRKVFLLPPEKAPVCIRATYDPDKEYEAAEFKTFMTDLEVGEKIIVTSDTRHGFTVCEVLEIDVEPTLNDSSKIHWAVNRFDTTDHENIIKGEKDFLAVAKKAELAKQREQMRETMMGDLDTDSVKLIDA